MKHTINNDGRSITPLAKMSIDPKFVELTADDVTLISLNTVLVSVCSMNMD